ncbi:hypothetical protein IMZ31_18850 (plasmid) [Pontibacillus sp. ALD_SL1]|uniref:hypothetical protein n=1 Tax=Pontibacillus sp. ALD_SL1 TaxID=2777185 RepID=UPI001A963CC5|nr:hypothetical protein [Pontibacillus sp. ALD_SL1]QST02608.1 hypothetical protein IMZ31_18850 [Pontibacillus sp. ALD_SL1]
MENGYRVVVKKLDDENYREPFELTESLRRAERVERGVHINLNHGCYYTVIEHVEGGQTVETIENY